MRRSLFACIAACTIAASTIVAPLHAAAPDGPAPHFEARDIFGLQWATDPQIRPDGSAVAYVRNSYDVMTDSPQQSIWLIDVKTGEQWPLAAGKGHHSSPRWSPDGERLAYVASANDRTQIFVHWMKNGASSQITDLAESPQDLAWSPDGHSIAFTMFTPDSPPEMGKAPPKPEGAKWAPPLVVITDVIYRADGQGALKPGHTHAFVVAADGGAPRQLTFGAYNETGPLSWSRDNRSIYLTGNRNEGWEREPVNTEIYEVPVAGGPMKPLTTRNGPDVAPIVSPDGKQIAWLSFEDRLSGYDNLELLVMDRGADDARSLTTQLDRTIDNARWAADGKSLFVQYADLGITKVARVSLDGKVSAVAAGLSGGGLDRPYSGGEFSVAKNGAVAFTSGSPASPSNVSIARAGRLTQLTDLNAELFRDKTLGAVEPIEVKSSFDQRAIGAWLVTPPDFDPTRKYPLILEIHGGPYASYGPTFSTDNQLYAAAGYVVLYTNPRGSTSYGDEFANLIQHAYPDHDYDDLMSAVDAAIAKGFVDPDNLFVTGGSGGGVLTAWIVGRTDRFRAAVTQKPVINWTSFSLTTDVYTYAPKYWFAKAPWEDHEAYWKRSPLSLVGNVKTPTMVVVGEQDLRTPVADSEQYYQALQLRNVPTALVKVPGASHGGLAARPSQSAAKASAILAWFEKYRQKN